MDFALVAVLWERGEEKKLHPTTNYILLEKKLVVKINYNIYNKELLAIIDSFKNGATFLKVLHIRWLYVQITRIFNIECLLMS